MRILGIDPGSRVTGFGIIDFVNSKQSIYIASGTIKTKANSPLNNKILVLATHIQEIIQTYKPDQVAIEQVFININSAASLVLGQARGGIIAAVVLKDIPIYEYTALQIKKAVVGRGKAPKEQVQHMIVNLLKLSGTPTSDAADALAVALTHCLKTLSPSGRQYNELLIQGKFL